MRTLVLEGGAIGNDGRTVRLVRSLARLGEVEVLCLDPRPEDEGLFDDRVLLHGLPAYDFRSHGLISRLCPHRRLDAFETSAPDGKFDLVLAWEHFDFVPPDRLDEFVSEIWRVMTPDAWLLLFALDGSPSPPGQGRPSSYRVTADDRLLREPPQGQMRPRWSHHNRAIHQALAPLSVTSVTLRRNRIREFLVHKPAY